MTDTCGCCEGIEQITPVTITNRPGLDALVYRVGAHATFLETMLARLSSLSIPSDTDSGALLHPLQYLTTRSTGDPAIALLDAWAILGDVLTFYQERIANEGYLRTAKHRRSILELARLVGYKLRPGVASSTYLAYTLQTGYTTLIPAGSRAQNIPAAGQLPQSFETSENLQARAAWNNLQPRMSIPQYITQLGCCEIDTNTQDGAVYVAGTSSNLKPNDPVLFVFGNADGEQVFVRVQGVTPHAAEKYTSVSFPGTFTPLVFLRDALDFVDRYLDLASFGVKASDPGVDEVTTVLELVKVIVTVGEEFIRQFAAGKFQPALFQEVVKALLLVGGVILWLEHLLDLMDSGGDPGDINEALKELTSLSQKIAADKDSDVTSLLQSSGTALQEFLQRAPDIISLSQTMIGLLQPFTDAGQYGADLSNLAQAMIGALQPFAQQAANPTLIAVLTAVQDALQQFLPAAPDSDVKKLANTVQNALQPFTRAGATPDLLAVTLAVQQVLSSLQAQISDQNVIALVQASLAHLDIILQTPRSEIDTLLQAIDDALDSFVTDIANLFASDSAVVNVLNRSRTTLRSVPQMLVHASIHIPALLNARSTPTPVVLLAKSFASQQHVSRLNPLQDILTVWFDVYFNAAVNGEVNVANWLGALLNELEKLVSGVPGASRLLGNLLTPAVISNLGSQLGALTRPTNPQPGSSASLTRQLHTAFARSGDIAPQLLTAFQPQVASSLYTAYSSAQQTPPPPLLEFDALRVKAAPFGSSAPKQAKTIEITNSPQNGQNTFSTNYVEWGINDPTGSTILDLDARYDHIVPESWVVIESSSALKSPFPTKAVKIKKVETVARADFGISAKVTRLTLYETWLKATDVAGNTLDLSLYRGITVYAQSEALPLAEVPLTEDIRGQDVELDGLYDGLQSGRWVVVSGERTDIPNTSGVQGSELMMLASVTQDVRQAAPTLHLSSASSGAALEGGTLMQNQPPSVTLPGDTVHTTLHFATSLASSYKRGSVTINGNVVAATQGETQRQVLGSGNSGTPMQQFALAKSALTYIPAVTPTGEESTLQVYVNNVKWQETDSLDAAQGTDHVYITQADDQDKVTITFGNGVKGARLPTGNENVKAIYRTGIGTSGNVDIGKISQLVSKPLGVKAVSNPVAATGGADRESRDQARRNVPLAATSLGRIVSVQDYADFARTFAGIGKASAAHLSDGQQQVVHVTIAGQDNIPIDTTSSLYLNLLQSLHTYGDPGVPLLLALAGVKLLVISARVHVQANYLFDDVALALRSALLDAFSFERRDLGQPVFSSEVISIMQQVVGVAYVDLDILDAVDQQQLTVALQQIQADALKAANTGQPGQNLPDLATLLGLTDQNVVPSNLAEPDTNQPGNILSAQLVFLSPDVQDTLILNELITPAFKPAVPAAKQAATYRRRRP